MKGEHVNGEIERKRLGYALHQLLESSLLLIIVLIVGYALTPVIRLLPGITLPFLNLSPGMILFLIIGALFVYSLINFVRSIFNFLKINPSVILRLIPGLAAEHPKTVTRLFFNALILTVILVVYWIFSPILDLIPRIGEQIAAGIQLAIAAVVIIFFWSIGSMIYRGLDRRLSSKIAGRKDTKGIRLLRRRVLNVLVHLLITAAVVIVAYASYPAISLGAHILIPGTGLTIGTVYWIITLAFLALSVFSLIRNLIGLFRLRTEIFSKAFSAVSIEYMSEIKQVSLNLLIVIAVLIGFFVISPYINLIPNIGSYLNAAGQVVVGAIVVLFLWDIGRLLYAELEKIFRKLEKHSSRQL